MAFGVAQVDAVQGQQRQAGRVGAGEVAVVVAQNRIRRLKPRVMILLGPDKKPNSYPHTLDLLYEQPTATGQPYAIVRALPPGAYGVDASEFYLT